MSLQESGSKKPRLPKQPSKFWENRVLNRTPFSLITEFVPRGDQPKAIDALNSGLSENEPFQTLLGVTGSGKTFTIANVIRDSQRPALVIAPNKTLAAQLYAEFKEFFPDNNIQYFVSYYDYYQPEAYIPSTDTFIEKDAAINDEIDKMRHSATRSLLLSTDVIIVASVSCIYGLGTPEEYLNMMLALHPGQVIAREEVYRKLAEMQYRRTDIDFQRGKFRVRGETLDIFPSNDDEKAIRIVFFGDEIEEISEIDGLSGQQIRSLDTCVVFPVSHFVTAREKVIAATKTIKAELVERLKVLTREGKLLEAQRLEQRVLYDVELLHEIGFCPGIENYSRHLTGRAEGEPSATLLDYFPPDFLLVVDESHVTIPQLGGMFKGDRSRKRTLVEHGFRLPSALDNRPLNFEEFWERIGQTIFVSATPADFEMQKSASNIIEQINRPTGLLDPQVVIRPAINQVDDLIGEIHKTIELGDRVLVTTLTKRMSEDLSQYLKELGIKCRYLHSDINTVERVEIIRGLRRGDFDVLIGINLLREGLDLVEVSLVAILDADKEGFLRSARSLIQTMGRAARNINGRVILYADKVTNSMEDAISESMRRRKIQAAFNEEHGIIPTSARRRIEASLVPDEEKEENEKQDIVLDIPKNEKDQDALIQSLKRDMLAAAKNQEFEKAAEIRDRLKAVQDFLIKS